MLPSATKLGCSKSSKRGLLHPKSSRKVPSLAEKQRNVWRDRARRNSKKPQTKSRAFWLLYPLFLGRPSAAGPLNVMLRLFLLFYGPKTLAMRVIFMLYLGLDGGTRRSVRRIILLSEEKLDREWRYHRKRS